MPRRSDLSRQPARDHVLPLSLPPRGLTREQAAAFVGLSPSGFDKARSEGHYPHPTLPGGRYDRALLELAMSRMSGILPASEPESPLDRWRTSRGAG
jgi:hypothetical protein